MSNKGNNTANRFSKEVFEKLDVDEKIREFSSGYRVPQTKSKEEAFELLQKKMEKLPADTKVRKTAPYWLSAAAVLLVAILVSVFSNYSREKIIAQNGEHIEYTLPDGSDVTLNAGSEMMFSESGFTKERKLDLKGEAFFSVKKGTRFEVNTDYGKVEVLGTTLNVYAREDRFEVGCLSGKVKVSASGMSEIILPGEKVVLEGFGLVKYKVQDLERMVSWKSGIFHFEGTPLISIFEEIERQFNIQIIARGINERRFSGSFSSKDLITEVLDTVCLPMGLTYEIQDGNKIRIYAVAK